MDGDSLHLLTIDLPIAFVLASPWLLIASARKNRDAPLAVPAVMLFVLGLSSLYVALVESSTAESAFQNLKAGSELLRRQHDLMSFAISALAAATLLFVIALLFWDVLTTGVWKKRLPAVFVIFAAIYGACTMYLLTAVHQGASAASHLSQSSNR